MWEDNSYYQKGLKLNEFTKNRIIPILENYLSANNVIDGSKIQSDWFPQVKADVFISHSHNDLVQAITLAGWLNNKFGLTVFIDSNIWGHSDKLLKQLDNKYCLKENGDYSYESRNYSTAHVHLLLETALMMMIDKTECVFFLNTPNSISISNARHKPQTKSPWIYSELSITKYIRKKKLEIYRPKEKLFSKALRESTGKFEMLFNADLDHLTKLEIRHLVEWEKAYQNELNLFPRNNDIYPLDILYEKNIII